MNKYSCLFCFFFLFIAACDKKEEILPLPNPECQGVNMTGTWSIVDSVEIIYLDFDSIANHVYYRDMILYENGIGKLDLSFLNEDYFFRWTLQCDPDIFTMSIPVNNSDSLFNPVELYSINPFDILVNDLDYKKMKREVTGSFNQSYQKRTIIQELTKN